MENPWEADIWHKNKVSQPKSTERGFGFLFSVVLLIIAVVSQNYLYGLCAAGLAVISLIIPRVLKPLNVLWFKFGELLHMVTGPIVLGLIFYLVVFPIGLIMRLSGKKLLNPHFDIQADSYWTQKDPEGPPPETMKLQF